jgi:hypothetical protein
MNANETKIVIDVDLDLDSDDSDQTDNSHNVMKTDNTLRECRHFWYKIAKNCSCERFVISFIISGIIASIVYCLHPIVKQTFENRHNNTLNNFTNY